MLTSIQVKNMSLAARLFRSALCTRNSVIASPLIQSRSLKQTHHAKLLCHGCYFAVDHRTDNKFVLCKVNPGHKQQQKNNIDYRLRKKYYKWGLQDLGASEQYVDARLGDTGYNSKDKFRKLKNDHKFDTLKEISNKAKELSSGKLKELD